MEYQIVRPDELYHHGILGMRWGVRRFQRKDGTWTNAGKKRREMSPDAKKRANTKNEIKNLESKGKLDTAKSNLKITKAQNKAAVQEARSGVQTVGKKISSKLKSGVDTAKKAVKQKVEEKKEAKREETVDEIIRSGDMNKLLKNKMKLSNDEFREAVDRMDMERRLNNIDAQKKQDAVNTYKRFADVVGTTANLSTNGINIYNNVSKVLSAMGVADLPQVGEKKQSEYDRRMKAARLRTAEAAAENAELNLQRARGQGQSQSQSTTNAQQRSSSESSSTGTHSGRQAGAERTRTRSEESSQESTSSTGTHSGRQAGAERTRTRTTSTSSESAAQDNAATRGLQRITERQQEMQRVRNQVRMEHGVNSEEYQRINNATNAMERVSDLASMRYRTRLNSSGLSETALSNAEREVDRLMSQARTEGVYRDLLGAEDILERYRNN